MAENVRVVETPKRWKFSIETEVTRGGRVQGSLSWGSFIMTIEEGADFMETASVLRQMADRLEAVHRGDAKPDCVK